MEESNCLRRWPGVSNWPSQTSGEILLSNGNWWALRCRAAGCFPRRGQITTFRPQIPTLSPSFANTHHNMMPNDNRAEEHSPYPTTDNTHTTTHTRARHAWERGCNIRNKSIKEKVWGFVLRQTTST